MSAGIYLHIPFCKSRCSYCDFATDIYRSDGVVERYVAALCGEIAAFKLPEDAGHADTIYFGGGTPSLLKPEQLNKILDAVHDQFNIEAGAEVTMEMNPATVTSDTLREYKSLGVNRASFGVQTFEDRALKLLARGHDANDARQTFRLLRDAGFDNVSFDLIAGLPGQTIVQWEQNLDEAIMLSPEHLSLYLLEIHEGTPLAVQVESGRQPMPDEELSAEMYEMMVDKLAAAGYEQYEISNFARPGYESRHNSKYWTLDPVYSFGVSAHSFNGESRYRNERDTARYVELIESGLDAVVEFTSLDEKQLSGEFAFLSLRLTEGIDLEYFRSRFGFELEAEFSDELARVADAGLIDLDDKRLKLTRKGMLYSNEVFSIFV
jgi:oxygen-independent coproporphyrinogen III oxidase